MPEAEVADYSIGSSATDRKGPVIAAPTLRIGGGSVGGRMGDTRGEHWHFYATDLQQGRPYPLSLVTPVPVVTRCLGFQTIQKWLQSRQIGSHLMIPV